MQLDRLCTYSISITFCSPAVSADAVGLGVRDALVAVGMTVSEDTGVGVTTRI